MSNSKQLPSYRMFARGDDCAWFDLGVIEAANPEEAFVTVLMKTEPNTEPNTYKYRGWPNAEFPIDEAEIRKWYNEVQDGERLSSNVEPVGLNFPFKVNGYYFDNGNAGAIYAIEIEVWRSVSDIKLPMKGVKEAWAIAMQVIGEQLYVCSDDDAEKLKERIKRAKELIDDIWNKCIREPPQDFTEADKVVIPETAVLTRGGGINWSWYTVIDGTDAVTFRLHNGDPNIARLERDFKDKMVPVKTYADCNWTKHERGSLGGKFDWLYKRYPKNEEHCSGIWDDGLTKATW